MNSDNTRSIWPSTPPPYISPSPLFERNLSQSSILLFPKGMTSCMHQCPVRQIHSKRNSKQLTRTPLLVLLKMPMSMSFSLRLRGVHFTGIWTQCMDGIEPKILMLFSAAMGLLTTRAPPNRGRGTNLLVQKPQHLTWSTRLSLKT